MKNKILIAYEKESSQTTRLTPQEVAKLVSGMTLQQLEVFAQTYRAEMKLYKPESFLQDAKKILSNAV